MTILENGKISFDEEAPFERLVEYCVLDRENPRGYVCMRDFIQWWNWFPHRRLEVLKMDRPELERLTLKESAHIASIVDSLCERDGFATPDWVREIPKLPEPTFAMEWYFDEYVKENKEKVMPDIPPACYRYNYFIDDSDLMKGVPGYKQKCIAEMDLPWNTHSPKK